LREQFIQFLLLFHAKIRQRVIVHLVQPGQPLEGGIMFAAPRYFPRRPNPLSVGVYPQTDQQLRIEGWPAAFFRAALDAFVESTQVQTADQRPDRPRWMVFADQSFHVHRPPTHLLTVHVADQWLVARIFLAHAASLRYATLFATLKFGGFLHSFVLRVGFVVWNAKRSEAVLRARSSSFSDVQLLPAVAVAGECASKKLVRQGTAQGSARVWVPSGGLRGDAESCASVDRRAKEGHAVDSVANAQATRLAKDETQWADDA